MELGFIQCDVLPEELKPGRIYFVESEGAIYVASSETEYTKYSGYKELEQKQEAIEELEEEIRTGTIVAESIPVANNNDIDNLFN